MKHLQKTRVSILIILCFFISSINVLAQDSAKAEPTVNLRYFINNNSIPYLIVQSRLKVGKKFQPLPKQNVKLFLDENTPENLIEKTSTDENGKAKVIIPPALQDKWKNNAKHNFIVVMEATPPEEEITETIEITKAKITMDTSTSEGIRSITVTVMFLENTDWVPAKEVEMKIGVDRSGGILTAGEAETYTTDSNGTVTVEFKRDSLPGDTLGNFVLLAKVEDNDLYGNLLVEKTVPWGVTVSQDNTFFDQRTLWSTRFRAPFWLLGMAYFIGFGVWGTLIYLVWQLVKIKKLGAAT